MATSSDQPLIRTLDHAISLPVFEGPLDLLLFLIRKNEIDIYDIPIERVTRQYLDILHKMEKLNLEVAGEFFVMAATLMYIKSRMLLPKDEQLPQEEDEDEDIDPRWELVQQLIEYKKFKEASGNLDRLIQEAQDVLFRDIVHSAEEKPERPLKPVDHITLWNTFNQVLRRLSERITVGQIHDETVTVAERMESILGRIQRQKSFLFSELVEGTDISISYMISTFLALLELTRLKKLKIEQTHNFQDIQCTAREEGDEAPDIPEDTYEDLTYQG